MGPRGVVELGRTLVAMRALGHKLAFILHKCPPIVLEILGGSSGTIFAKPSLEAPDAPRQSIALGTR